MHIWGTSNPTIAGVFQIFFCYEMSKYNNPNITTRVIFEELIRLDRVTKCGRFSVHVGTCQDSKYGSEEGKFYRLDKVKTLDFSFRLELMWSLAISLKYTEIFL